MFGTTLNLLMEQDILRACSQPKFLKKKKNKGVGHNMHGNLCMELFYVMKLLEITRTCKNSREKPYCFISNSQNTELISMLCNNFLSTEKFAVIGLWVELSHPRHPQLGGCFHCFTLVFLGHTDWSFTLHNDNP